MSDATQIDTPQEIHSILSKSKTSGLKWWLWRAGPDSVDKSPLFVEFKRHDQVKEIAQVRPSAGKSMNFTASDQLFLGSEDFKVAFKLKIKEIDSDFITIHTPQVLNRFEGTLLENASLLEIDNEEKAKEYRVAPRTEANGQLVGVSWNGKDDFFQLHDISTGGMALIANDPGEFTKGDIIEVFEINSKALDKKLKGKVQSIRAIQTGAISSIKVGIQFQ